MPDPTTPIVIYHTPVKDVRTRQGHVRQPEHRLVLGAEHVEYLTEDSLGTPSWRPIDLPAYKAKLIELALRFVCVGGSRMQVVTPHVGSIEIHLRDDISEASGVLASGPAVLASGPAVDDE